MGCYPSRVKPMPFTQLRQFIQDQRHQRRERKRQKDLKRLNVLTSSADNFPSDQSPYLTRAGSTHSSLASTSLVFAMEDSTQSLSSGSSSDNIFSNLDFFALETSNVDEDDDEEDNTHPQSATQTVTTLSDDDDSDVDGLRNLTMRKCSSDQIEVIIRATAAAAARQRALNRATVSITATGIKSRMPTIPENKIPSNDNLAPLPHLMPTQTTRASWPDEFCLPGFIP